MYVIKRNGYMLVEVLVAVTLISLVMVVVVARVSESIAANRLADERAVATRLATEAAEWLKANREDMGWAGFMTASTLSPVNTSNILCWDKLPLSGLTSQTCAAQSVWGENQFDDRIVTLQWENANKINFTVSVRWKFGNRQETETLTGSLEKGEYE